MSKCYDKKKPKCKSYCVVATGECVKKSLKTGKPYGDSAIKRSLGKSYTTSKKYGLVGSKEDVEKYKKLLKKQSVKSRSLEFSSEKKKSKKKSSKSKEKKSSKKAVSERKKQREQLKLLTTTELKKIYNTEGGKFSKIHGTGSTGGVVKKDIIRAVMRNRKKMGKMGNEARHFPSSGKAGKVGKMEYTPTKLPRKIKTPAKKASPVKKSPAKKVYKKTPIALEFEDVEWKPAIEKISSFEWTPTPKRKTPTPKKTSKAMIEKIPLEFEDDWEWKPSSPKSTKKAGKVKKIKSIEWTPTPKRKTPPKKKTPVKKQEQRQRSIWDYLSTANY